MVRDRVTRHWSLHASIAMAFVLLVIGSAQAVFAANQQTGGIVAGVATPDETGDEQSREPTPFGEESPGGVVGGGPQEGSPTPTPVGDNGGEAVAPGTVTVVVWTSDQGVLPERAMVCIGEVCQSVSNARSGIDLWFDRVERGRQQIVVNVGAPYGATTADVEVKPGSNSRVELTLVVTEPIPGGKLDPTPPPVSAEGPLRNPVQLNDPQQRNDSTTSPALSVSGLPATGTTEVSPVSETLVPTFWVISGLLLVAAATVRGVHRT